MTASKPTGAPVEESKAPTGAKPTGEQIDESTKTLSLAERIAARRKTTESTLPSKGGTVESEKDAAEVVEVPLTEDVEVSPAVAAFNRSKKKMINEGWSIK
jgi:hypothetical protein